MEVQKLSSNNIEEIRELYNSFLQKAKEDYLFELPPLDFDNFKDNFLNGFIKGYYCKDIIPKAFLLYSDVLNQAIEITLIFSEVDENDYKIKTALLEKFSADMAQEFHNKTISYPMLGIQNNFTQDITNIGFKPVGEMIVELDFRTQLTNTILNDFEKETLPSGYTVTPWNNIYTDAVTKIIYEEFSKLNDAKFDPRFRSFEGTKSIINEIIESYYGEFAPKYTTVLMYGGEVVGCCFVNFTTNSIANIPIIAIRNNDKQKGCGLFMVKNSANLVKKDISNNLTEAKILNATCDTENYPAVRMYRKAGFKEKIYYTHAYKEI